MKSILFLLAVVFSLPAFAVESGEKAPDFSLSSSQGKKVSLSDYKGKTVVLEWLNYGCPFVKKHYGSGNMQSLQKEFTGKGVEWISIISSAPGKQGHSTPKQAEADRKENKSNASEVLIDEDGKVGKLYGAKTTPHMYIINESGILIYQGAIDDKPSADKADVKTANNYVKSFLVASLGKDEKKLASMEASTTPYGCSVKYK
ncbi:MAG: redoxin domain-containing protein [Oligoflexia bacterium]|nr:redoxin domain-containing protein [Oligoflexia bacterium]